MAIDSATAKIIAQAAIKVTTDEETMRRVLMMILAPVVGLIVLRGVTSEGKILVADPASHHRSEQEWDLSIILNEARNGAGAGGPFWLIGP